MNWKKITSLYECSKFGKIRKIKSKNIIGEHIGNHGYKIIRLKINGQFINLAHRQSGRKFGMGNI